MSYSGSIAQLAEHGTENPGVPRSTRGRATHDDIQRVVANSSPLFPVGGRSYDILWRSAVDCSLSPTFSNTGSYEPFNVSNGSSFSIRLRMTPPQSRGSQNQFIAPLESVTVEPRIGRTLKQFIPHRVAGSNPVAAAISSLWPRSSGVEHGDLSKKGRLQFIGEELSPQIVLNLKSMVRSHPRPTFRGE